jgi:hypothetical protein
MTRLTRPAVVVLVLGAAAGRAADPKPGGVDLSELKYAVTVADKRGDNVELVREAAAAFERALAKSLKAGDAAAELGALRAAVECAARKGENVEAISKELGRIEKALTGREYQRPKPPEPEPEPKPEPDAQPRFGRDNPWGGRGGAVGGRGATTVITVTNGNFTIKARRGGVNYTVTGSVDGIGAPKIVVQDGDTTTETEDVKKVPAEYRPTVERLLKMVQRG